MPSPRKNVAVSSRTCCAGVDLGEAAGRLESRGVGGEHLLRLRAAGEERMLQVQEGQVLRA